MHFLLKPLIINLSCLFILILLLQLTFVLFTSIYTKSTDIFKYKVNNISGSIINIIIYIFIIIVGLFILRLYNLPRNLDLNNMLNKISLILSSLHPYLIQYCYIDVIYLGLVLILLLSIILLSIIFVHKLAYKEMHKLFLFFIGKRTIVLNSFSQQIEQKIHSISLRTDILMYYLINLSKLIGRINDNNDDWNKIPYYNIYKLLCLFESKGYYKLFIRISPIFFIIYDCLYNNFVITHVFYYLLFYIPLQLFTRFTNCVSHNSYYITKYLYNVLYKEEDCLYAASPTLKAMLDNYILLGFERNFDLGVQSEGELIICALTRFELADKNGPLDETYVNEDSQFLHTYDKVHYFHIVPDENGEPIHGVEWTIIVDKTLAEKKQK